MTDSYIALDLETTGLEPKKEKITEIYLYCPAPSMSIH